MLLGDPSTTPSSYPYLRRTAITMNPDDQITVALRAQVATAFPRTTITSVARLPPAEQHPLHRVELSDGTVLLLSGPALPSIWCSMVSRFSTAQAEAIVLGWLAIRRTSPSRLDALSRASDVSNNVATSTAGGETPLDTYLPKLVRYFELDGGPVFMGMEGWQRRRRAYTLTVPCEGQPITSLGRPLSHDERSSVDYQCGKLLRVLAEIESPNGHFGFAAEVLSSQPVLPAQYLSEAGGQRPIDTGGNRTWSDAYDRLVHEARLDASKKTLIISFGRLRVQFERFRGVLDNVMRPRLVALRGGEDWNTLVQHSDAQDESPEYSPANYWRDVLPLDGSQMPEAEVHRSVARVTGFRDWSNLFFGDPLIASALSTDPSVEMVQGFSDDPETTSFLDDLPSGLVDDRRHVHIRLLLYRCYWAIREIIRKPRTPYIKDVQISYLSPGWKWLDETLRKLEALPSASGVSMHRARRTHVMKRRRSESPPNLGYSKRSSTESVTRSPFRSWSERRRCSTP